MSALWHWFLTFIGGLHLLIPSINTEPLPEPPLPEQPVMIELQYGDIPEVAGVTSELPNSLYKREAERVVTWSPPETDSLTAESIMIMDKSSGKILWSRSPEKEWPMASITKLMSAIVFMEMLEDDAIWDLRYTMTEEDEVDGTVYLYRGEDVRVEELFNLSLVGSINSATRAMMHAVGLTDVEAVEKMNKKAREFGLWNTSFSDVTGLSFANMTTAKEAAWLLKEALAYDEIQQAVVQQSYSIKTDSNRSVNVLNTNKLLGNGYDIEGGKTGFISESRYNFAVSVKNNTGDAVIIVVMGTDDTSLRFSEASALVSWTFDNYTWR
jgi:serine-type D-Ala-D-Ala carboxypeptidase (penicillin-binding protein 5/6)